MKKLYVGESRKELERLLGMDVERLPCMDSAVLSLSWEEDLKGLYVIKTDTAQSIRQLAEQAELVEAEGEGLGRLKEKIVFWDQFLRKEKAAQKNSGFQELCSCLDSQSFTGVLLMDLRGSLKKPEAAGASLLLKDAEFKAPFVQWSAVDFPEGKPVFGNSICKGVLSLCRSIGLPAFTMTRTDVFFRQGEISFSAAVCQVGIGTLFSAEVLEDRIVELYGGYASAGTNGENCAGQYRMVLMGEGRLVLSGSAIQSVWIKTAEALLEFDGNKITLTVKLGGSLCFSVLGDGFDPFSYGSESGEGLPFTNLELKYTIRDKKLEESKESCGMLALDGGKAVCRKGSFGAGFTFQQVSFLCHEQAEDPKQAGFCKITVPYGQKELPKSWYGLVFCMEMMQEVQLELLFAFGTAEGKEPLCVYAGARLKTFGTGGGFGITVGGLFRIGFQSICVTAGDSGAWQIRMKGLSVGMFRLSFPNAGCDIVLMSGKGEDQNPCNAWYAVYDNRKEACICRELR